MSAQQKDLKGGKGCIMIWIEEALQGEGGASLYKYGNQDRHGEGLEVGS